MATSRSATARALVLEVPPREVEIPELDTRIRLNHPCPHCHSTLFILEGSVPLPLPKGGTQNTYLCADPYNQGCRYKFPRHSPA